MHAGSVFSPHLQAGFPKKYRMKPMSTSKGVREGGKLLELENKRLEYIELSGNFSKTCKFKCQRKMITPASGHGVSGLG